MTCVVWSAHYQLWLVCPFLDKVISPLLIGIYISCSALFLSSWLVLHVLSASWEFRTRNTQIHNGQMILHSARWAFDFFCALEFCDHNNKILFGRENIAVVVDSVLELNLLSSENRFALRNRMKKLNLSLFVEDNVFWYMKYLLCCCYCSGSWYK